jgi:hypothetical protein
MSDDWFGDIGSWLGDNAKWLVPTAVAGGSALYGASTNQNAAQTQANALQQSGQLQANAITQASNTQQQAADNSLNFLRTAYDTSRADQAPWRQAGQNALGTYAGQLGQNYQQSPGYQFQFNEGQRALQNGAAAQGMFNSGATQKALTRYGQGVANQDYGNWMNRQASLAGVGQTAANAGSQAAQQFGGNAANISTGLGSAVGGMQAQLGQSLGANASNIGNVFANSATAGAGNIASGANSLLKYASSTPGFWS